MDKISTRLAEALRTGNVDSLKKLLEEDEFLLERVTTRTSARDNPLHITALLGHASFAAEIMSRNPELAKDLNEQGLSPLHLAAANGHLPVVKELLKGGIYRELCFMREEIEGMLPLHVAVIKGRSTIVKELVEACEASVLERIYGGESVLHLAVKSNSLETLEFLISRVDDLNATDDKGNTVLHLAVARKQSSMIKLLLREPSGLDVNMMNSKGFTPLDVLLESRHEYGDLVLGEMIRAAGGTTATLPQTQQLVASGPISIQGSNKTLRRPRAKAEEIETASSSTDEESTKGFKRDNPDMLMVVATLIATITFQAALNPPGGFVSGGDSQGQAVLAQSLTLFLIYDLVGLFCSVSVLLLLLCAVPNERSFILKILVGALWLATFSTALAFTVAIRQIFVDSNKAITILIVGWYVVLLVGILWVSIRLIIFLLQKGKMLEAIKKFFSPLMENLFKRQWMNAAIKTTHSHSSCLRKTAFMVLIFFLLIGILVVYASTIYSIIWLLRN